MTIGKFTLDAKSVLGVGLVTLGSVLTWVNLHGAVIIPLLPAGWQPVATELVTFSGLVLTFLADAPKFTYPMNGVLKQ
jgi:hypothetical protein